MTDSRIVFKVEPIGVVERGITRLRRNRLDRSRYQVVSRIKVFDCYMDGLLGLDAYSHIILVWLMHRERAVNLRVQPWGSVGLSEVGVFATRFPVRPNHVGVSAVQLMRVSGNRLSVRGLDAWTGTPILDVKPYDYYDIVKSPRVPHWFLKSWAERAKKRKAAGVTWLGP